jgi:ABC-type sulfate transport system permease component
MACLWTRTGIEIVIISRLIFSIIIIIIIIIIIMSIVPLGTLVVYKSPPAFSVPGDEPEITSAMLTTFIQCIFSMSGNNAVNLISSWCDFSFSQQ